MEFVSKKDMLDRIRRADSEELNAIIPVLEDRFRELWPDWDLLVISVNGRRPEDHMEALQNVIHRISHFAKENDLP